MGPDNPFLTEHQKQPKNTVNGYVESTHVNQFQFENQRRTFMSYGYAVDPNGQQIIGDTEAATQNKGKISLLIYKINFTTKLFLFKFRINLIRRTKQQK